jgi:hypothetical protein
MGLEIVLSSKELEAFRRSSRKDKMRLCIRKEAYVHYLNDSDTQYFNALQSAFALLDTSSTSFEAVRLIRSQLQSFESLERASELLKCVTFAYNDFLTRNQKLENFLYARFQQELAQKLKAIADATNDSKDYEYASRIAERAAKAGGYAEPSDEKETIDLPKLIVISSNERLLEAQKKNQPLDDLQTLLADGDAT